MEEWGMTVIYVAAICFFCVGMAFVGYWIGSVVQELGSDVDSERWSGQ